MYWPHASCSLIHAHSNSSLFVLEFLSSANITNLLRIRKPIMGSNLYRTFNFIARSAAKLRLTRSPRRRWTGDSDLSDSIINKLYFIVCRVTGDYPRILGLSVPAFVLAIRRGDRIMINFPGLYSLKMAHRVISLREAGEGDVNGE
jgi:hypothetical protein